MQQETYEHALGLCILATEELGKAIMLKEKVAYARKRCEETSIFERVKPELFFKAKREDRSISAYKGICFYPAKLGMRQPISCYYRRDKKKKEG